ncbi:MAG: hypothetical protein FD165_1772 [Gammaproteobacteria bacterium]|nr:MAG: hypothetical protein FD165_1772 [Gammaproteobacteria bacterium]TND04345.1 MAG: hypothetical protein FD120_1459 [Gammaproteobacteria bacterium]
MRWLANLAHNLAANPTVIFFIVLIVAGLLWKSYGERMAGGNPALSSRVAAGVFQGRMPGPAEQSLTESVRNTVSPRREYRLMTIRHIPRIAPGEPMPHPFVGECTNCHLIEGGPPAGSQPITPVGEMLQRASEVKKLGPPILPTSQRPHPPAGRCIKCHDIVVQVPVEKKDDGLRWVLNGMP